MMSEQAYFAAGCFWGVEQAFRELEGVLETEVGYTGGTTANPTYEQVCAKTTGHAEAVKVTFDPARLSFEDLLTTFWAIHDPTQIDRQGPDIGSQYRTAIFPVSEDQKTRAETSKQVENSSGRHSKPVATAITALGDWWPAEDYHQHYFEKRGGGVCAVSLRNNNRI